jgi:hypothetical protein
MKKHFLLLLMTLLPLASFATGTLNGTTQYAADGFKYKILSIFKTPSGSNQNTVSVSQNVYATNGAAAMVIPAQVEIYVKGTDDSATPKSVDQKITFKVVEIEANAFAGVTKATSIQIGSNVKTIGANAFDGCSNVTAITFDTNSNDVTIANDAFKGTKVTELDLTPISGTLASVGKWFNNTAFTSGQTKNNYLETIKFPKQVSTIETDAFAGFKKLTNVVFAEDTTSPYVTLTINAGAFQETPIEELDLTHARITVLNKLFEDDNVTLKKVIMSKWVNTLNTNALANCIQLNSVDFSQAAKLTTLMGGSLSNTVVKSYDFSKCYETTTSGTLSYTSYLNFTATQNPFVNGTTTTNKNLQSVVLPLDTRAALNYSPVTVLGTVFANCEKLTTITNLEKSKVTTIDDKAFEKCISLPELTLPNTVLAVNGAAFDFCEKLAALTFKGNTAVAIGDGTNPLFGTNADALAALKTLTIEGDYSGSIKANALKTATGLSTLTISKGKTFSGTIEANAIKLAENANATVEFGDVTGTVNTIAGPVGIYKTTLTLGKYNHAHTGAWVSNTIDVATVNGTVDEGSVLTALGSAEKIVFNKNITVALTAPAAANAVLTAIEFNGNLGNGATADIIPATAFDENNAPILATVKFAPAVAPTAKIFNIAAFNSAAQGANAKVTLTTTAAVADLYGALEANLYNIIFVYDAPAPVPTTLTVYGMLGTEYYYGKLALDATKEYKLPKVTEKGEQVVVYSAFVDDADNTIYMDPLAIEDGYYYVPNVTPGTNSAQAVIVRVKNPQTTTTSAEIEYLDVTGTGKSTMRYDKSGNIVNDLQNSLKLFSSDFIGTTYTGKSLFAMKNPVNEGKLVWGVVSFDSYLPKNSVFVETNESAAARLSVVWLDGNEDVDGIINHLGEKKTDGAIYNLNGVRVQKAQKGIFIINGKKVVK